MSPKFTHTWILHELHQNGTGKTQWRHREGQKVEDIRWFVHWERLNRLQAFNSEKRWRDEEVTEPQKREAGRKSWMRNDYSLSPCKRNLGAPNEITRQSLCSRQGQSRCSLPSHTNCQHAHTHKQYHDSISHLSSDKWNPLDGWVLCFASIASLD